MKSNNNTKQIILESASKLIAKQGIKSTSLADIAKYSNISKGTLYYYYSSKYDIIADIADTHLEIITKAVLDCVKNVTGDEDTFSLVQVIVDRISTISSTGRIHMYLICEAITENEALRLQFAEKYREWRFTLREELIKAFGGIKDEREIEALSFLLISVVDGLVMQSLLKAENIPYSDIAKCLVNTIVTKKTRD